MPLPDWCPPIRATKQIPDTLGAGAESISIMGDFTNMIIGMREQFTIEVLKEIKSQNYQNVLCGALRADIGILRPAAFDITDELTTTWYSE